MSHHHPQHYDEDHDDHSHTRTSLVYEAHQKVKATQVTEVTDEYDEFDEHVVTHPSGGLFGIWSSIKKSLPFVSSDDGSSDNSDRYINDANSAYNRGRDSLKSKARQGGSYADDSRKKAAESLEEMKKYASRKGQEGKNAAGNVIDDIKDNANEIGRAYAKGEQAVKNTAQDAYDEAEYAARDKAREMRAAKKAAYEKAKAAYEGLEDTVVGTYDSAKQSVHDQIDKVAHGANKIQDTAHRYYEDTKNDVKEAAQDGVDSVRHAGAKFTEAAGHAKKGAQDVISDSTRKVKQEAEKQASKVKQKIGDKVDATKEHIHNAAGAIKDTASTIKHSTEEKLHDIQLSVEEKAHAIWDTTKRSSECLGLTGPRSGGGFIQVQHNALSPAKYSFDANPVPVAAFWTAISTLWFLWLANKLWRSRNKTGIYHGECGKAVQRTTVVQSNPDGATLTETTIASTTAPPTIDADKENLRKSLEAKQAFINLVPMHLIQLVLLELCGVNRRFLHTLAAVYLLTNIAHVQYGIWAPEGFQTNLRSTSLGMQWIMLGLSALRLAQVASTGNACLTL